MGNFKLGELGISRQQEHICLSRLIKEPGRFKKSTAPIFKTQCYSLPINFTFCASPNSCRD